MSMRQLHVGLFTRTEGAFNQSFEIATRGRGIDHVRDAFDFSEVARNEIIPKRYWASP